jgi:hypothetical protein
MNLYSFMKTKIPSLFLLLACLAGVPQAAAQGTAFMYQGQLNSNGIPANGLFDFQFSLYTNAAGSGSQIGSTLTNTAVGVTNGLFTTTLDFGDLFTGDPAWLAISVRTNGLGSYVALSPLQELAPTPYAIYSGNAGSALTAASANSVAASNIVGVVPLAQLPAQVLKNKESNVTLDGTFSGNGGGLTNLNAAQLTDGLSIQQNSDGAPNLIAGSSVNFVAGGVVGATIGGGGATNYLANVFPNSVAGDFGTIGGGLDNQIQPATQATIGGGYNNQIQTNANGSTIGGGCNIQIQTNASFSTIGGGTGNQIQPDAAFSTIGGGNGNEIQTNATESTIAGGNGNEIQPDAAYSTIAGGYGNQIQTNAGFSTIAGGNGNQIQPDAGYSTIAGGNGNQIQANATNATIGGGYGNQATGVGSFVGGGGIDAGGDISPNIAGHEGSVVVGGLGNWAGFWAAVVGGYGNQADGNCSFVGGGGIDTSYHFAPNIAYGFGSVVGGGMGNQANGTGSFIGAGGDAGEYGGVGLGESPNIANGPASVICGGVGNQTGTEGGSSGLCATIPGGYMNVANAGYTFAAGSQAQAVHEGAFVWADSQDGPFSSAGEDTFNVRAQGGVRFASGSSASDQTVSWSPGTGSWTFSSDQHLKDRFEEVNKRDVLEKVAQLPVMEWSYKNYSQRHIGAMAQDFHALFPLNDNDQGLNDTDLHGVELAAIQGLNQKLNEKDAEIEKLKAKADKVDALAQQNESLAARLNELEAAVRQLAARK